MKLLRVLTGIFFLGHLAVHAQEAITAVATKAACVGDGTITITVKNVAGPITYAVAKLPYNEAKVITSVNPVITNLETGDYYYGYYSGTTFVKAAAAINVGSNYSAVSPTISAVYANNYTYCGSDPDPLGRVIVQVSGGNAPYTVSLLNASDNSEVQKTTVSISNCYFNNVLPGTYKAKLVDNCGVTTITPTTTTLAANVLLTSKDIKVIIKGILWGSEVDIVNNTPGDVCSGIVSAALPNGFEAVAGNFYINTTPPFNSGGIVSKEIFLYKLEIQNGTGWDVYDNLTYTQVIKRFPMPSDRSKWGLVRLTGTYCGLSQTVEKDYGASVIGEFLPFSGATFYISDDPANTNCATTGKVSLSITGRGGCLPYTLEITNTATNTKKTYTFAGNSTNINDVLLDIGQTYSFKFTDNTGVEVLSYDFRNNTTNQTKPLPNVGGTNNVFINPDYFSPAPKDLKSKIKFDTGASGQYFGKSALGMQIPASGLQGLVTVSLESGPSALTVVKYTSSYFLLGNNLTPGSYQIRVKDSGCFNEVFEVVLDSYFTKVGITSLSSAPSATICDRYVKTATVTISAVGEGRTVYGYPDSKLYVNTVSGPVTGIGSITGAGGLSLQKGTCVFSFAPEVSGTYEIGLSKIYITNRFLLPDELWENTTTATIKVEPNFPTFDLSQSGGIICTGNTTGNLYVKVDNTGGAATYFIKKDTDAAYPATGQTNPVFTGLTAGNYTVKAKTACYEVEQPLILRAPLSKVMSGSTAYCDGGSVWLIVNQTGPVASIKWTTPNGTVYNTADLKLDNLTPADSGMYKVEVTSLGGCYFTESFNVNMNDPKTPTGASAQEFCKNSNAKLADLKANEAGVMWYDAATGGTLVPATTPLINGKIYYGALQLGDCKSVARFAVTVTISDPQTPTTAHTTQEFCKADNKTVADLATGETGVTWFDAAKDGNAIPSTTVLENNKTYYGSLKVGTCESPTRLAVTVTLSDPQTPTTTNTTQEFCKVNNNTVADLKTTETGVTWYDDATGVNAIVSTTLLENNKTYYGSLKAGTCESPTRLAVTVTLSDPQTPTGATTQEFCKADNNTVADLVTIEKDVTWYDTATKGNIIPVTTALTNGTTYYGSLKAGTCESPVRLAVTVTLNDPKVPTGISGQMFCKENNPRVGDLKTNETGVTWYDKPDSFIGRMALPATQALENNKTYYGTLKLGICESRSLPVTVEIVDAPIAPTGDLNQQFCKANNNYVSDLVTSEKNNVTWYDAATAGNVIPGNTVLENNKTYYAASRALLLISCESTTRLAVTVTINDPQTPTGTTAQEFCKVDNKTVADLKTTESDVTWYDDASGVNVIPSTTLLENNKVYYGSLKVGTCESQTRLAVTVTLSDPQTPTGATTQEFCKVDNKTVADLKTAETGVTWYDDATGINAIPSTTALENNKVYYGSLKVGTCESPTRLAVTVTLSDPQTPTGATTQEFCKADNKTVADLKTAESGVTWYDDATGVNAIPSNTVLTDGTTYYGSLKVGTCESPTRLAVTVMLNDPQTPTGSTTQEFCKADNKTVADLKTAETGVTWYDDATGINALSSTAFLENNKTYYGSLKAGTCESPTRLAVTVTLSDPQTPTGATTQEFCKVDDKTVADLKTAETGVTWYDDATGVNVIPSTTLLENNKVYYGSLKVGTCESPTRLAVTVTLSDPQTPTGATTQEFCKVDNKTVADLKTTETGVTWYDAAKEGNAILPTTVLENNKVYYGSLKEGNCESPIRLAVKVTLNDPQTPIGSTTQEFCKVDNKTVADLKTTESGVTWYDDASGVNVIPSTTLLENNKVYYGSIKEGTCESPKRLAVTVTLSDPQSPTGATTQEFCKADNKTVADLKTAETGVTWYDDATGVNVIPSTTALENNKEYYGSLKVGTCESPNRLAVTVTLSDPQTPTGATTQEFCKMDNKTVADLKTAETGVTWYDDATGINAIASTALLENNKVYYGCLKVGTCESPTRLAVTVILSDPQTPTGATTQEFCKADNKTVADLKTAETGVTWYDDATGVNVIPSTTALENNKEYYGSLKVGTCESPNRLAVTVTLSDPQTPTGATTQEFCKMDNKTVADLKTAETGVTWYDDATGINAIASTALLENNKVYYGCLKVGTCESPTRLPVTVTLSDPQTPTGATTQEFCKVDNKTVADLKTVESGVTWYDDATGVNAIPSTTALENNKVYYGSLKVGTCESPNRLAVTVTLSDPQTPTGATTQEFCKVDDKTVADLKTAETGVTWYDDATGVNVIPSTTLLENNKVYYGSLKVGTCESPTRLAVTVTLSDPQTPTGATTQEFCKVDNKTVADLKTAETGVTWYDDATGINAIPSTTALENNKVYYGSLKVGTCESPTRLAVTVTLSDPQTPTGATTQEFCKVDNNTVADLATTESGVTWYDDATGINAIPSTTLLENNKVYYGSLKVGTCESPTRLAVTVTLSDPQTPTGATTQEFCKADNKTVADLKTTETGVTWYDDATGVNALASTTLLENNKTYYGSLKVGTCESPKRFAVTVTLSDPQTPTGATVQEFCKADDKTIADLKTAETGVTWYDDATRINAIPSTTLLENNKVYYGSLKVGTCESPTRLAVTVTLSDPQTLTGATTQEFCKGDDKTVADLKTTETGVTWYADASGVNAIPSTTVLTDGTTYYGSLKVGTCESPTRLAVTVTLSDPQTPTGATTQEFCKVDNNTVADLVTTETGVTWYDSVTGVNALPSTTALESNKVYYGSLKVGTCESPTRLAVRVTLSDPKTPTGASIQEFCRANNSTVADLKTTETGVTWFDAEKEGNVIPSTTLLENNKVYYGSLKAGNCESPTRLAITVTLSDPQTPTGAKTQEFCEDDHAKVSDLVTTESNVTWFDAPKDGKVIAATTALIHGTVYYGSLKSGSCESPVRLAVKVNIKNDSAEPAPNWSAASCVFDEVTYKTIAGMSDYNWLVSSEGTVIAGGQPTDDFVTVVWNAIGKATVNVDYINTAKCDPIVSVIFPVTINSCSDISIQNVVDNPSPGIGQKVVFTIKAENLGTHDFKEVVISEMLPTGYEYVDSDASSGTYNAMNGIWNMPVLKAKENQTLTVTTKVKGTGDYLNVAYLKASNPKDFNEANNRAEASIKIKGVIVYNAVSPNEDGLNDYFKIDGLEQFPHNTVEIFNSGGVQIFKTSQYGSNNNVFRGISEGRATINKKAGVPTGTYFYILRYEAEGEMIEKAGYLYVTN